MWEFGDRGWVSVTVGVAADGISGQGAPGRDNEHKGLADGTLLALTGTLLSG